MVSVDALIDQGRGQSTFAQIVAGARCRACGCKGQVIFPRIVYANPAHIGLISDPLRDPDPVDADDIIEASD
jgi:hypothetical protein